MQHCDNQPQEKGGHTLADADQSFRLSFFDAQTGSTDPGITKRPPQFGFGPMPLVV
jgi:hypothetical protein